MYRQPLGPEVETHPRVAGGGPAGVRVPRSHRSPGCDGTISPTATVAGSFGGALAELLAPLGVAVLDSTHPAVKRAAARHLVRALGLARELDRDLGHRAEELRLGGADPGVAVGDGATLVMLEGAQGRDRLVIDDGGFMTRRGRERFDLAALQNIAADRARSGSRPTCCCGR